MPDLTFLRSILKCYLHAGNSDVITSAVQIAFGCLTHTAADTRP